MARRVFQMRDKYKSTTNLYPKQIEQSLPKDVVPVAPEPEAYVPTGEEPEAEYITINNVTYKVGGGTEVVANPTLAGTEADLTGLQVGDTKYKVPSGGTFTQEQADWTEADNTKPSYIKNKPSLATVATSGSYNDLTDKPTIPTNVINYRELMVSSSPVSDTDTLNVPIIQMDNTNNYIEISGYAYLTGTAAQDRRRFTIRLKVTPLNETSYLERPKYYVDYNNTDNCIIGVRAYCYYDTSDLRVTFYIVWEGGTSTTSHYGIVVEHIKEIINY